jgi:hypothetical protein
MTLKQKLYIPIVMNGLLLLALLGQYSSAQKSLGSGEQSQQNAIKTAAVLRDFTAKINAYFARHTEFASVENTYQKTRNLPDPNIIHFLSDVDLGTYTNPSILF